MSDSSLPSITSLADVAWPVVTPRLTLRRFTEADVVATWPYRQRPEISKWLSWHPESLDDWRDWFIEHGESMIAVEHDGVVIGDLKANVEDAWAHREIEHLARATQARLSWVFHPDYGGRGLATEAVEALVEICLAELGLRRVVAYAFLGNEPSWRLMERVGMRREAVSRAGGLHRDLGWVDGVDYAVLADEWLARRSVN